MGSLEDSRKTSRQTFRIEDYLDTFIKKFSTNDLIGNSKNDNEDLEHSGKEV